MYDLSDQTHSVNSLPEDATLPSAHRPHRRPPIAPVLDFAQRLLTLRKARGLTQQALAERVACSLIQIHRYESAGAQPSLDVIRRLALALTVSTDELIFGADARGPSDDFRLQFEALADFDPDEKKIAKAVLDSLILTHQARRWASAS